MATSKYGARAYGRGLYSAIRNVDVSSFAEINVNTFGSWVLVRPLSAEAQLSVQASAIWYKVSPLSAVANVDVTASADLWVAASNNLLGTALISITAFAELNHIFRVGGLAEISVNAIGEDYIGPPWAAKDCTNDNWSPKKCGPNPWSTVKATPDQWSNERG